MYHTKLFNNYHLSGDVTGMIFHMTRPSVKIINIINIEITPLFLILDCLDDLILSSDSKMVTGRNMVILSAGKLVLWQNPKYGKHNTIEQITIVETNTPNLQSRLNTTILSRAAILKYKKIYMVSRPIKNSKNISNNSKILLYKIKIISKLN